MLLYWLGWWKIKLGLYSFIGEECGCIGSSLWLWNLWLQDYDRIISFDRRRLLQLLQSGQDVVQMNLWSFVRIK